MEKVTIGADPEFLIRVPNTDRIVDASYVAKHHSMIGTDAIDEVFEIRPNPSVNIFHVLGNIRYALRFLLEKSPKLKSMEFIAGHGFSNFPIGGHIHIGRSTKSDWLSHSTNPSDRPLGLTLIDLLDKLLHYGLGDIVQDKDGYKFRRTRSYGRESDYREGHRDYILEYRTPPSWLVSPTLAFFYLCLAKVSGLIVLNHKDLAYEVISKRINGIKLLRYLINRIDDIKEFHSESDICKLINLIDNIKFKSIQNRDWTRDFKKAWGL